MKGGDEMDNRLRIPVRGTVATKLKAIAAARGQTLTAAASFLLAEGVETHYARVMEQARRTTGQYQAPRSGSEGGK